MARMKYSKSEKLTILSLYKDGHHSIANITAKFSVDPGLEKRYEMNGEDGLTLNVHRWITVRDSSEKNVLCSLTCTICR
ncbi:helix-turn-helix domain-containing protein [Bacillus pseudomycoides]|uniref:helix-turn-helix domain-containing protein n=1 Tax=Bacillus pseudomycoides TaxID=64104 RepID=UPI00211D72AF|nr:helix-turn-helix domain-containing protein [Bacillus pseudomycoides]